MSEEKKELELKKEKTQLDFKEKVLGNFTQFDINTLKASIAAGLNVPEFNLFLNTAAGAGLNPFLGHITPVLFSPDNPEKRKMNIQIAVEGIEHLARNKDGWQGVETQLICENDEFKAKRDSESGRWMIEQHEISFPRGKTIAAYSIAKRKGFEDVYIFMEVGEVEHMKQDYRSKAMWEKWFNDMFKKHVKKRALREQFGIELDDMESTAAGAVAQPEGKLEGFKPSERKDITQEEELSPEELSEDMFKEMEEMVKKFGLTDDDLDGIRLRRLNLKPGEPTNNQQMAAFRKFIELEGPGIQKAREERKAAVKEDIKKTAGAAKLDAEAFNEAHDKMLQEEPETFENVEQEPDDLENLDTFFNEDGQGRML